MDTVDENKMKVIGAVRWWRDKVNNSSGRMNSQTLQTIQENLLSRQGSSGFSSQQNNKIVINVGGIRYETYKSTLRNLPDTRLAWLTESKSDNPDFDPVTGEYFFDRHPNMFLMVLNYYRTGKLHVPSDICGPAFEDELAFWGIDEKQIESCCWGTYSQHRDAQMTLEELKLDTQSNTVEINDDANMGSTAEKFGILEEKAEKPRGWKKWQPILWSILDDHMTNRMSKAFTVASLLFTLTTILTFILETHPCCRNWINESLAVNQERMTAKEFRESTYPMPQIHYLEVACMVELTVELIARVVFCPTKKRLLKGLSLWIDVISLLSFYASLFFYHSAEDSNKNHSTGFLILNFTRLFRVLRIINLAKHLSGFKILLHTIVASAMELLLMFIIIISLGTIFASLIFYAEQVNESPDNYFISIPHGMWWAIVTMTTLGYGDMVPKTLTGYMVGAMCAIFGVMLIALPIPIIVNNFSVYYNHAKAQEKLPKKKRKNALVGAADALKQEPQDFQEATCETISEASSIVSLNQPTEEHPKPVTNGWHHFITDSSSKHATLNVSSGDDSCLSDRSTKGISVTFVDSADANSVKQNGVSVISNGRVLATSNGSNTSESVKQLSPPGTGLTNKGSQSSPALIRRSSLLPGGVSNVTTASNGHTGHRLSLSTRAADPRNRRRSLLPSASGYL